MIEWIIFISDIAAGCVRAVACLFLIFYLLPSDKPGKKCIAITSAGIAVISLLLAVLNGNESDIYRIGLEAVWISFCAGRIQGAQVRMSLFVGIFYEIAVSFWQFLFSSCLGILLCSPNFLDYGTGRGQIAVWLIHGVLAAFVFCYLERQSMTEIAAFQFASIVSVSGFLAVITLSEQRTLVIAEDLLDMWTVLSIVLMMSVLIFRISRQYEKEKELAKLKSEQAELLERDYTTLNHAYEVNAKLFHDFHNHIGVLQQLLSHQKIQEAEEYLNSLQAPVREMTDTIWTGDETIDYLINSMAARAKSDKIEFLIQVEFPRHTNVRSADLCAVIGNFLDNALEAARQASERERKYIRLTIRRINQMLVIKVENSFGTHLIKEGDVLKTTKAEEGLHGWGLKSARTAAEKYSGCVQTMYTDCVFQVVATLSFQEASQFSNEK